jgi:alkanesulfonate monooxygenase SsuD/methylene tetrahydromethanopterin reductase-like flavin-dependent oxidoreductase (luciferase family)
VSQDIITRAALEQVEWADGRGFDCVWVAEHHGADDGYCHAPLVLTAAFAARTRTMRIQTAVLLLPLYNPLRVAEDVAIIDQISGGRFDLGIGIGYRPAEFIMLGKNPARRPSLMEEGIRALRMAWTGEPFEYEGTTVCVTSRPCQSPHPPIIIGGASEVAAQRAARLGDGFIPSIPTVMGEAATALIQMYHDERARLGLDPGWVQTLDGPVFCYVSDDPERAWETVKPYVAHDTGVVCQVGGRSRRGPDPVRRS